MGYSIYIAASGENHKNTVRNIIKNYIPASSELTDDLPYSSDLVKYKIGFYLHATDTLELFYLWLLIRVSLEFGLNLYWDDEKLDIHNYVYDNIEKYKTFQAYYESRSLNRKIIPFKLLRDILYKRDLVNNRLSNLVQKVETRFK
jgi:hypothetical protein